MLVVPMPNQNKRIEGHKDLTGAKAAAKQYYIDHIAAKKITNGKGH